MKNTYFESKNRSKLSGFRVNHLLNVFPSVGKLKKNLKITLEPQKIENKINSFFHHFFGRKIRQKYDELTRIVNFLLVFLLVRGPKTMKQRFWTFRTVLQGPKSPKLAEKSSNSMVKG